MSRPVTAGIDGSAASLAAAEWAAHAAVLRRAPLRLLSSWARQLEASPGPGLADAVERRRWARRSLALAADRVRGHHPELEIVTQCMAGPPLEGLLAAGTTSQLLVLGARGLGGPSSSMLGSTGIRTAERAAFPLVLFRPAPVPTPAPAPTAPVLLAMDAQRPADEVIAFAFEEAARRNVDLHVVYAWSPPVLSSRYPVPFRPQGAAHLARRESARLAETLRPWREKSPVLRVVEQCLYDTGADAMTGGTATACLMVIGHRVRSRHGPHLGPVAQTILHDAACPVALIPHR